MISQDVCRPPTAGSDCAGSRRLLNYAALSELPRGADERHEDAPEEAPRSPPPDRLGSLALPRHACHVTVRFKCLVMSALFEGLATAVVEDRLVSDVVIALLISFQLPFGRMYHHCRARCVVVALCWALSLHRRRNRQRKNQCREQLFGDVHLKNSSLNVTSHTVVPRSAAAILS